MCINDGTEAVSTSVSNTVDESNNESNEDVSKGDILEIRDAMFEAVYDIEVINKVTASGPESDAHTRTSDISVVEGSETPETY